MLVWKDKVLCVYQEGGARYGLTDHMPGPSVFAQPSDNFDFFNLKSEGI